MSSILGKSTAAQDGSSSYVGPSSSSDNSLKKKTELKFYNLGLVLPVNSNLRPFSNVLSIRPMLAY